MTDRRRSPKPRNRSCPTCDRFLGVVLAGIAVLSAALMAAALS